MNRARLRTLRRVSLISCPGFASGGIMLQETEGRTPLPAGPDLPGWSQAQAWIEDPVDFWERCAALYGDPFTVQLGSLGSVVLFSDPSAVRQIFQLPADAYECHQYNEHYKYVMGEQSLLVSDGPRHRSRRR